MQKGTISQLSVSRTSLGSINGNPNPPGNGVFTFSQTNKVINPTSEKVILLDASGNYFNYAINGKEEHTMCHYETHVPFPLTVNARSSVTLKVNCGYNPIPAPPGVTPVLKPTGTVVIMEIKGVITRVRCKDEIGPIPIRR